MTDAEVISLIGYASGVMTVASFIPQALKTYATKDVSGLSFLMYTFFNLGILGWITYGYLRASYPLMIFNSITFLFAFPVWIMIIKYHNKETPLL